MNETHSNSAGKKDRCPIIGIGASAGGMAPFKAIIDGLPVEFNAAIVFMQHLPHDAKNQPPGILSAGSPSRAGVEITDSMLIENGKVYVNPPGHDVTINAGRFRLKPFPKNKTHFPIDIFFTSIAEEAQDSAIAVILSGAGADGARGIREVQCKGGAVLVQDPATAEFTAMPQSAIEAGDIDEVLAPENIAKRIVSLTDAIVKRDGSGDTSDAEALDALFNLLREKAGYGFEHYKKNVIARRVQRRMSLHGISRIDEYRGLLDKDPAEFGRLASDLMIGVTGFFRDPGAWKSLKRNVIAQLITDKITSESIRVWTPGCSTGEEAYSIAMIFLREIELAGKKNDVQVFATDINEKSLTFAREGRYPSSVTADIPAEYLKTYFTYAEDGMHLRINKYVRDHVVFAKQNLLADPPFSKLDLLICRNLLIYLEPESQDKSISIFHYTLKENGHLFLGNAESIGRCKDLFKSVGDKNSRLYQRTTQTKPVQYTFPAAVAAKLTTSADMNNPAANPAGNMAEFAHETLLSLYAPAAVLINHHFEILYFNGPVKRFIEPPKGNPSFDFISWLPEEIRNRVRGMLYNASQTAQPVSINVNLPDAGKRDRVATLTARLYDNPTDKSDLFLVVFSDQASPQPVETVALQGMEADRAAIRQLERELSTTRDELQTNVEELRSANEELQSSNEEMQASNEELETSREELQSLNEELVTVNTQLQVKIEEQEATNDDLNNFLSSTKIPTLFLDRAFNVRRFTPAMIGLIKLIPSDVGRPIGDMSISRLGEDLLADAQAVLDKLSPVSREVALDKLWYVRSALPYMTSDNRIEGVVITFVDITNRKKDEEKLAFQSHLLANVHDAAIGLDADFIINYWNESAKSMYGWTAKEAIGRKSFDLLKTVYIGSSREEVASRIQSAGRTQYDAIHHTKDNSELFVEVRSALVPGFDGKPAGFISISRDQTDRKRMEEEIKSLAKFPSENPNPIMRMTSNGVVLYANEASEPILQMWNCEVGRTVPEDVLQSIAETVTGWLPKDIEIECNKRIYSFNVVPIVGANYVNLYGRDITERKNAERTLRESQRQNEFLASVIDFSSQPFAVGYPDGHLGLFNNAFEQLTGYYGDELRSIDWATTLTPPEWREIEQKKLEDLHKTELPVRYEKEYIRKDGTRVPIELLVHLVKNMDNKPLYYYSFITDITVRRKTEEALRESEKRFRLALKNAPVSVAAQDKDLRFIWAYNQRTIDPAEIPGKTDTDIFAPEDAQKLMALKRKVMETGQETSERIWLTSNGKRVFLDLFIEPLRSNTGEIIGVGLATVDLTPTKLAEDALRQSEERFHGAMDNMLEGCQIIGMDWRFIYINGAAQRHNRRPNADLIGNRYMDMWPGIESTHVFEVIRRCMEERTAENLENEFTFPDGKTGWFDLRIQPVPEGVFILSVDITERKRTEQALRESEERFRTIAETMPVSVCVTRLADSIVMFTNEVNNKAFGLRGEDIIGTKGPDYYCDPADRVKMMEIFKERGVVDNYPLKVKKNDGTPFWIMTSVRPIMYNGQPAVVGASIDITDRIRMEEQLHATLDRFYLILANMPFGILLVTNEDRIEFANQAFCDIFSLKDSPEDLLVLSAKEMIEKIRVSYNDPNAAVARIGDIVKQGRFVRGEDVGMLNGRTFLRDFIPIRVGEKKFGRLWLHMDITERKKAEEALVQARLDAEQRMTELKVVLDVANVAIWIAHDPQCLRITGNRFADEVIMQVSREANISASARPGDAAVTFKVFRDEIELKPEELPAQVAAATGKSVADEVLELRFPNGRSVYLFEGAVPLFDAEGRVRGAIATAMDITERRKAEEQMKHYVEELRVSNEELERFNHIAVDRELRMIELKKETNALRVQTGQAPLYPLDFEKETQ